jgi:Bacterial PH domain
VDETWVRPYPPGSGRWLVIGWEAAALAFLAWSTIDQFAITGTTRHVVAGLLAAIWVIGTARIIDMGVYIGDKGLQVRGLLRTRRVPWAEIAHVRLHKATHRIGRWQVESGMTVLIERRNGSTVNTELWAQGIDFHARPSLFRAVYRELRDRHLATLNA